jgi:hypothetical protein
LRTPFTPLNNDRSIKGFLPLSALSAVVATVGIRVLRDIAAVG